MDNNQYPTQPVETPVQPDYNTQAVYSDQQQAYQAQPTYAQQPVYAQPAGQVVNNGGSKALSIIALVCGICSLVFCWVPVFGVLCGVAGIILGSVAKKKGANGMNKTGLILGIIGTIISAIYSIVMIAACSEAASYSYDYYDYYYTAFVNNLLK